LTIVFLALIALRQAYQSPKPVWLIAAGVIIGIGAATRPSFLTLIGLAPIGLWCAPNTSTRARIQASGWLIVGVFLGLSPFTLRNLIASGRFVVLVNSWIQIPYFLIPPEVTEKPGGIPGFGEALRMARDIFVQYPARTLWVEVRKLLFTFGLTGFGPPGERTMPVLVTLTILFAVASLYRRIPKVILVVLITFAVSHVIAMVIAAPWTFSIKSIIPLHIVFLFGSAFLLDDAVPSA
jgi:hypothetical protein